MAKKILQYQNDYILDVKFKAKSERINDKWEYQFVDEEKKKVKGKLNVNEVSCFIPVYDNNGYHNGYFTKIIIPVSDILKLAEEIKQIDATETIDLVPDDLPF